MSMDEPDFSKIPFDKTEEFEREIHPLIDELVKKAKELGIPIFVTATLAAKIDEKDPTNVVYDQAGAYSLSEIPGRVPVNVLVAIRVIENPELMKVIALPADIGGSSDLNYRPIH